jgi:hypothetical protein
MMTADEESPARFKLRRSTLWFLGATVFLIVAASLVGIADNPPGVALLYGAGLTGVLTVSHRWKTPRKFGFLMLGAVLGFFIMVVVHNFAEVGAETIPHLPVLAFLLSALSIIGFIVAVIICPVAGLVGLFGWMATSGRKVEEGA